MARQRKMKAAMFDGRHGRRAGWGVVRLCGLIHHNTARKVRKAHGNAVIALFIAIFQSLAMVVGFYLMYRFTGLQTMAIRGDFLLYIMSGVFLYFTHVRAMSAVVLSEGPASPMMQHLPMTTTVAIASAALGALYVQLMVMLVVLGVYHLAVAPVVIADPAGAFAMVMLSWLSGVGIGLVFLGVKPWAPDLTQTVSGAVQRINMFASGKLFVANMLPAYMLSMFDWNPLFHTIDQARGFIFVNYTPHYSSIGYPVRVTLVLICVGLMAESRTRKRVSLSWSARR